MKSKGRERKALGVENGKRLLTDNIVRSIRYEHDYNGLGYKRLAKKFNITVSHARAVALKHIWKHII